MYVLKCVKPGYFNYDLKIRTGCFMDDYGHSTKSLARAAIFKTKREAKDKQTGVINMGDVWINPPGLRSGTRGAAVFEIVPVIISLKE